ncbi:MAG: hypothetical protein V4858_10270 [Pseudomonadota bacterium]
MSANKIHLGVLYFYVNVYRQTITLNAGFRPEAATISEALLPVTRLKRDDGGRVLNALWIFELNVRTSTIF